MKKEEVFSTKWLGRELTIKSGKLAGQADAAITVQYGETVVLATVVESNYEREGVDFFPLMVEFEERLYAAGIIKGSRWIKREGRPTDEAVLTGRMIDRSIRPLFDEESRKDVQVVLTVLSVDQENDHDIVALIAASAALAVSPVKWNGPIGGIRVGRVNGELVFNPTYEQRLESDLDLIVAGTDKKTIMIEAGASEIEEKQMLQAILEGQKQMQEAIDLIKKAAKNIKAENKPEVKKLISEDEIKSEEEKEELFAMANNWLKGNIDSVLFDKKHYTKGERKLAIKIIKENLDKYLFDQGIGKDRRAQAIKALVESAVESRVTNAILEEGKRVDGRKLTEIRELIAEVGILPRNHGAGLFSRGETQVMSIVTLGAPGMEQNLEGIEGKSTKRYMHHYNFPPYSVGEASPMRSTGRREIGHGALAEKALMPVIPAKEDFPYTIRVVSETLSSNGSSSMASTCGSTLALMDAGVPIKKHVAGIAMGLASNQDMSKWEVLTDIQDLEDGKGGMDFKITGTDKGLTAIQLDTKTDGLTKEIIEKTLIQGREALNQILEVLQKAIPENRAELSKYAPRILTIKIDPEKIGLVIGQGGKTINGIIGESEITIDIDDDGLVMICGTDAAECQRAKNEVEGLTHEFKVGEIVKGKVVRMMDFGAFVALGNTGQDGMVHVSELAPYRVSAPSALLAVGDEVTVKVIEIDEQDRINLTMKGLAENDHLWKDRKGESKGDMGGGFRNNGFNNRGGDRPKGRFNRNNHKKGF